MVKKKRNGKRGKEVGICKTKGLCDIFSQENWLGARLVRIYEEHIL